MPKHLFLLLLFSSFLQSEILYTETFEWVEDDEEHIWPEGWTHNEYIEPSSGEETTSNWRIEDRSQPLDEGFTPPAAVFWWSPSVPQPRNDVTTWYELYLQSPDIDVGDNDAVLVKFDISLDFYNASAHTNGLLIEANGGSGWVEMLKYEIGPGSGFVEINFRTESFTTDVENGTLQLRWTAYGTDSFYIDAWILDNIKVISLPKLSAVHIESNNTTDNQTAIEGDLVTLDITSENTLAGPPYVQINGSEVDGIPQGNNNYKAEYIVSDTDADGPLTFSVDFTSLDGGIDGATVNSTSDNSKVIIDRTPPPPFTVSETVTTTGGNVFIGKWNSTNTALQLDVNVPEDSSVVDFNYFQGNSISFNGANDRVVIPSNSLYQFSDRFTAELWIKPNTYQDYEGVISYGMDGSTDAGFAIAYFATGWRFYLKTTDSIPNWATMVSASAPAAQWTHLACTYDGSMKRLYRNGNLMDEQEMTGNIVWDSVADLYIGYFNSTSSNKYFDGNIDEVRLWNIVRTGAQIKGNKSINLQGNEDGLVGYWKADESSGTTLNDMTSNQIDGSLNGAAFTTLNSPINFSTPVYDNTVIIGSNYQLRTKIGSEGFQNFGDLQEITNDDFVATTKTISSLSSSFTAVNGYLHNETALLSAVLYDQSGNFTYGDTSAMSLEIDLIANDPTSVIITSNNANSTYAKTGDMVTITMSYNEDIISTSSSVENNAAVDTDLGSEQFKSEYTLTGSEPEGVLDFVINAADYMGNPGSYSLTTDGSQVTYDKTPPELTYVNISSNNADTAWAKVNDSIVVTFLSNEAISLSNYSINLDGVDDYIQLPENIVSSYTDFTFMCRFRTDNNNGWARLMDFGSGTGINMFLTTSYSGTNKPRFAIKKSGGGEQQLTATTALNQGQWYNIAFTIENSTSTGKLYIDGELVAENNSMTNTPSDLGNTCCNYFGKSQYNDPYFDGLLDNVSMWSIPLTQVQIQNFINTNPIGNESNLEGFWDFNEGAGSIANDQSVNSNNGQLTNIDVSSAWVNIDSESLIPTFSILGQTASVSDLQNNKFSAVYVPTDSDTEGEAAFEIQFSDLAGNDGTPVINSTNNTKVIFDRTAPADFTVGLLTPTGGNQVAGIWNLTNTGMDIIIPVANDTTLKNGAVQLSAKIGSNSFEPLGSISTILPSEINTDKTLSVTGELIEGLTGFAEGETIYIKATMNDRPGNSTEGTQSATEILIDETPASISPISIISNNDNTTLAKEGDTVMVSFNTSEILIDTTATISGQIATIAGLGSNQFKAVYAMTEGDPEGIIAFEISIIDVQGNPLTGTSVTTDGSQVTFDKTKPTLDPVTITSDNSCSAGAIAKAENIVTINFTSLETLLSTFAIVMGDTVSVTDQGSNNYKIDHQLTAEDTEGEVSFLIRVMDLSGNISEDIITTTDGSNVEFDITLPILTNVHIESNNNYSSIAVLGDVATLTFEANEPLSSTSIVISSSSVIATESDEVYTASYTIQDSDIAIGGFLSFAIDFVDCPGNSGLTDSTTTDESFVSIDVGPPEMVSVKIFSANQDSSWAKIDDSVSVYFVVNEPLKLDGNPTSSLKIGGNTVDIYNVENTSYQGDYVMTSSDIEGLISLEISFFDLGSQAGNDGNPIQSTTNSSRVIFDKTNPVITAASFTTNNVYGSTLAKVDDVGEISISFDENIRSIATLLNAYEISLSGIGQNYSYSYTFSDSNNNGTVSLNILASDSAGNQSDTLIDGVYFDKTSPRVISLYEGSLASDQVYTKYSDSLQLAWTVLELESGSKTAFMALGSDSGLVDILNWIPASDINQASFTSINLSNNSKYFGAVFVEDNVGNISDSVWGNGIIVDIEAPNPGIIWDGFLSDDIDYTADSTKLYARWSEFTDNQSIDYYEASVGSQEDTTNISDWQQSTDLDNIQFTGLSLEKSVQYFAYLRAVDSATNISSVIRSDGVEFDNTPPDIKSIYPLFDSLEVLSVLEDDEIQISFNKPILKFGLNVSVGQDTAVNYTLTEQDSGVTISILDRLPSYEIITVTLDTAIAFNLLNYTDTIIFRSKLWGDLNNDYQISVEDVLAFNQSWPHSSTDLGPVSGSPPYLFPSPDGELNLTDLSAFGKMWIWYYHEYSTDSLSTLVSTFDNGLNANVSKNKIELSIPDQTYGAEVVFFNSNESLDGLIINNLNAGAFNYSISDSIQNSISFIIADKNGLDSLLSFSLPYDLPENFISNVKYKFIDEISNQIDEGVGPLKLTILPNKFDVYQNYPNPFNAETIVRYELPQIEDVTIKIYDVIGREIFSAYHKKQRPGKNTFIWKGNSDLSGLASSGMYFLQISAGKEIRRMKMILLK